MAVSNELQGVIAQMLKPLKNLSLAVVIEGLSGYKVIPFDAKDKKDREVLEVLRECAQRVKKRVNEDGIPQRRANEVGNAIESFVKEALNELGYRADTPKTLSGRKKSTGYPDLEFEDRFGRVHYLECKTFNKKNIATTQRSFYISPSNDFKITRDAHHFGISFEVYVDGAKGEYNIYKINSWKIFDLFGLNLDVKYEFNSDNKRLYDLKLVIAQE